MPVYWINVIKLYVISRYGSARTVGSLGFGVEGGVGPSTTLIVSTPTNNMINSPGPEVPANGAAAAFAPPKKIQLNDNQDIQRYGLYNEL